MKKSLSAGGTGKKNQLKYQCKQLNCLEILLFESEQQNRREQGMFKAGVASLMESVLKAASWPN